MKVDISQDDDDSRSIHSVSSTVSMTKTSKPRTILNIAKNISLTGSHLGKSSRYLSEKQRYHEDQVRWNAIKKMYEISKEDDPLTFAQLRLETFTQFYDMHLQNGPNETTDNVSTMVIFWAIKALTLITGAKQMLTKGMIARYYNNESLKENEKIRILKINDDYFGIYWSWLLALDTEPCNCEVFSYTTIPIPYRNALEHGKEPIGPKNHHLVYGKSLTKLPFSTESYPFAVSYDFWFRLTNDEWAPALSELHRVLKKGGFLHMLIADYVLINGQDENFNKYVEQAQATLKRNNIDPVPSRHIEKRLKEAGFTQVQYSIMALRKGLRNKLGAAMDFLTGYFEWMSFRHVTLPGLSKEELEAFREMKKKYNEGILNGTVDEYYGDAYVMLVVAQK